eukprot:1145528-Pelagomonas_calceolata.AAC.2
MPGGSQGVGPEAGNIHANMGSSGSCLLAWLTSIDVGHFVGAYFTGSKGLGWGSRKLPNSCSRWLKRTTQRTSTSDCVRQPHQLNGNQRHVHLIESKHCEDTRPGQQLGAAQRQQADLCKRFSARLVSLHTILLGVGETSHTEHTLNQFKQLRLDHQRAIDLAHKLHAYSFDYARMLPMVALSNPRLLLTARLRSRVLPVILQVNPHCPFSVLLLCGGGGDSQLL